MNITVLRMREFLYNDLINIKFYTKLHFIEHLINYMDHNLIAKSTKISIQRISMKPVWGTYILALLLHWGFFFIPYRYIIAKQGMNISFYAQPAGY